MTSLGARACHAKVMQADAGSVLLRILQLRTAHVERVCQVCRVSIILFSEVLRGMLVLESFTKHPPSTLC